MSSDDIFNMTTQPCLDCGVRPGQRHALGCSFTKVNKIITPAGTLAKFDTEIATITQRRGDVYGDPTEDFNRAADLMSTFDHVKPKALRHALRMICVKLARIARTPDHLDSYVDIVGYARTAVMVLDRIHRDQK